MCGVFGFVSDKKVKLAHVAFPGMFYLQHRGQEGAGVAFHHEGKIITKRRLSPGKDSVNHLYTKEELNAVETDSMVGQNRYSTNGSVEIIENIQPIPGKTKHGQLSLVHNGNLRYANRLRSELIRNGVNFSGDSDTEIILQLITSSKKNQLIDAVVDSLEKVQGSYSLIILTEKELIAARDPYGFRPLSIAQFDHGHIIASETCAFDAIDKGMNARFLRDVEPGEIVVMNKKGLYSIKPFKETIPAQCVFELIYFARPDSLVFGRDSWEFSRESGRILSQDSSSQADFIFPVPDSAVDVAAGFAEARKIQWEMALVRNHYAGRTFIDPEQLLRDIGVRLKLNPKRRMIEGRNVAMIDDSIVRGTTMRKIVRMIRGCNPKSVSVFIASSMFKDPCYYGIDTPSKEELIASHNSKERICKLIEADSLDFLSLDHLKNLAGTGFCYACFDGKYPF